MTDPVLRAPRESDAEAIVSCFRVAFGDDRHVDAEEILRWLASTDLRLKVAETGGRIVGFADLVHNPANDELEMCIAAHGFERAFLDWAERSARAEGIGSTRAFFPAGHPLENIVRTRGYTYWNSSLTMHIELEDAEPPPARVPGDLTVRAYEPDDEIELRAALNEVFVDDPFFQEATETTFREWYLDSHAFDPAHWHLAWDGEALAGFALAFAGRPGDPGLGHVSSLGVRTGWRRRGLGEALLRTAFAGLHRAGLRRIELGVVADNTTGAVRLYERVGMRATQRWDNWVGTVPRGDCLPSD